MVISINYVAFSPAFLYPFWLISLSHAARRSDYSVFRRDSRLDRRLGTGPNAARLPESGGARLGCWRRRRRCFHRRPFIARRRKRDFSGTAADRLPEMEPEESRRGRGSRWRRNGHHLRLRPTADRLRISR